MTANIRTSQRTVSAMQRFAVSQKNRAEATTISPFSLSLPYRTENRRFSALSCAKTGSTQPKLSAACFVVQSCLADADFVVFSNYCLIGTRESVSFSVYSSSFPRARRTSSAVRVIRSSRVTVSSLARRLFCATRICSKIFRTPRALPKLSPAALSSAM